MTTKKPPYRKRLTRWKIDRGLPASLFRLLAIAIPLFCLAGCATKPWRDPLGTDQAEATELLFDTLAARDQTCGDSLEADIALFYKTPFDSKAVNGFLQFSLPSSYKFVMTNPLGQPLLAIAGDQLSYQVIDTINRRYLAGTVRSFGIRNDISSAFLAGDWANWLMGRNSLQGRQVTSVRHDRYNRGVWVSLEPQTTAGTGTEHLLMDPDRELYLTRIIEDSQQRVIVEIAYEGWAASGKCMQPLDIYFKGLDYGSEIHIKLSDIVVTSDRQTYRLPIPPGYMRHFLP